jgi:heterodisulfide reductase subunit B2
MNKYLFYPGCSMQKNAKSYLDSLIAIRPDLEISLEEIEDWNCCGATEYWSVHQLKAHALVGRNLALAEQQANGSNTVVAGCSACFLNLAKTANYMEEDVLLRSQIDDALAAGGLHFTPGSLDIRHLLDIVYNDVGIEKIRSKVVRPLTGLRIAPYYGCMIVRPDRDNRYGNPEYPTALDKLMEALGATVIDFPQKTHCCGGHMTQISPDVAYELLHRLISGADRYHADLMVTLCPMCQLNLDAYQGEMNTFMSTDYHMPVLYFTQLIGLAFGYSPEELGIGKEFVNAGKALAKIGVEMPEDEEEPKPKPRRKKKEDGLPMPRMGEEDGK